MREGRAILDLWRTYGARGLVLGASQPSRAGLTCAAPPALVLQDKHISYVRDQRTWYLIVCGSKPGVSAMSDEKEIREVMRAERKHKTVKQQEADLRQFMLKAIRNCDEESFLWAVTALGHEPGSDEYEKFRKK